MPFLQKKCGELGLGEWTPTANNGVRWKWHNTYATTIHALNSALGRYDGDVYTALYASAQPALNPMNRDEVDPG